MVRVLGDERKERSWVGEECKREHVGDMKLQKEAEEVAKRV